MLDLDHSLRRLAALDEEPVRVIQITVQGHGAMEAVLDVAHYFWLCGAQGHTCDIADTDSSIGQPLFITEFDGDGQARVLGVGVDGLPIDLLQMSKDKEV